MSDEGDPDDLASLGHQPTLLPDPSTPPEKTRPRAAIINPVAPTDPGAAVSPAEIPTLPRAWSPSPPPPGGGTQRLTQPDTEDRSPPARRPERDDTLASREPASAADAVGVGTLLDGKYQLVRQLGAGGMGKVYKGQHLSLGVPVAVKVMHPHVAIQEEFVRRFRHEAHAASVVSHPNVVRVLDFGEGSGVLYLVMEYLEGRSVGQWLDRMPGPPPLADVQAILEGVLDALDVAHRFGIVHRDLKPDNVYLADLGGQRVIKVLDFGLAHVDDARDAGPTLTSKDAIAGTPDYMSPEQCRSLVVGPSADLYSVGCLLTTLLQLRPPFQGMAAIDTMAKHMFSRPPPLQRPVGAEAVPPLLEKLRMDLLAKLPERRPRSAAETKARLLEAMSPIATEARLPTRKGDEPLGDRAARLPDWSAAEPAIKTPRFEARTVGLWRLPSAEPGGVSPDTETALAAQNIDVTEVPSPAEAAAVPLLVLDVGPAIAEARALLGALREKAPSTRVIVCAAKLGADQINELIGAGAADVARYPIATDALVKKIDRVLRRGR